ILSVAGSWGWKIGKLVGTYLLFLGGLLAMRAAHAAGDLLQKLLEAAIRRARERTSAARQAAAERATEIEVLPEPVPQIGVEGASDEDESDESEEDEATEIHLNEAPKAGKKVKSALEPGFEVPNALPELETPVQLQIKGVLSQEPAILPPESPAAVLEAAT